METPRRASFSQFSFHSFERYGKLVSDAWYVPNIVAMRNFRKSVLSVSSTRATISDKLQNCFDCKIISPHGLPPHLGVWSGPNWSKRRFGSVYFNPSRL